MSKTVLSILILWISLIVFANPIFASHAFRLSGFYLDINGFGGYTGTTVASDDTTPKLAQFGLGFTGAYQMSDNSFAGLSSDYRFINQYSAVIESVGNRKGTRWNIISPTIGVQMNHWTLKGDFQFLGNYELAKQTSTGSKITYKRPLGGRITALYPFLDAEIHTGLYFEYLSFGYQYLSSGTGIDLSKRLLLWQIGVSITFEVISI